MKRRAKLLCALRAEGRGSGQVLAEEALEFIADDELVEITPDDIRLRKKLLRELERRRSGRVYE